LNATGRGWINKTGTTQLGLRNGLDCTNTTPGGGKTSRVLFKDSSNANQEPHLDVTFSAAAVGGMLSLMGL
jgi:hypothetical protein